MLNCNIQQYTVIVLCGKCLTIVRVNFVVKATACLTDKKHYDQPAVNIFLQTHLLKLFVILHVSLRAVLPNIGYEITAKKQTSESTKNLWCEHVTVVAFDKSFRMVDPINLSGA